MSIKNKVFAFFVAVCILLVVISGVIVIEKVHLDMINNEISELLDYEDSIKSTIFTFLMTSFISEEPDKLEYIKNYLKTAQSDRLHIEIHSDDFLIMKTHDYKWEIERKDVIMARNIGKNYLLMKDKDSYYIAVSNKLPLDSDDYIISIIKDVSYVMLSRNNQYRFFIGLSSVTVLLLVLASYFMSKFITKDIVKLTKVTESIKSGEYDKRIDLNRNDEIGLIANHIDDMANEIESNIHKLEEQTISKQRFIDNFTHELKTPLTSIIGYADLLRKNKYDKELFDKGLYHIYEEGKRLSFISKSMTEIILLKNREMNLSQENILDLLNEVKEVNELRQYGKNLLIDVKSDSIAINVDKYLLKTVLINLLDNAIKASEDKQSITIGAYKDNEVINIYVEDYGKGISSEDLGNILEPFYLVDKSRCKKEESLGLGLSICSEILELMNAKLHIASEVNQGTKVNIQFDFTTS